MPATELTLFYDGLCPLCAREIAHYRRLLPADTSRFIDIADPAFAAEAHGLEASAVQRVMHVKVGSQLVTGVDAFLAIWDAIPRYRTLARLGRLPPIHLVLRIGYAAFARLRPWLPRRPRDCATGQCQIGNLPTGHEKTRAGSDAGAG